MALDVLFNGRCRKLASENFHAFSKICCFQSTIWAVGNGKYLKEKTLISVELVEGGQLLA